MKLLKILLMLMLVIPTVNAQAESNSVFFLIAFDTIILLVITVFIFLTCKKMLGKIGK